jgi:ABC-2 type transport system permease protein
VNALLRLEGAATLRARWFAVALALCGGLVGFFVLLATRESAIVGFTGFGRVITGVVLASLLFVPLVSVFSTAQAVTQARQQGVLEFYLSYPLSRDAAFWGLFTPRAAAVTTPVVLSLLLVAGVAALMGQPLPFALMVRFTLLVAGQAFCFAAIGMMISVIARTAEQALLGAMSLWMATAALIDFALIGVLLRFDLDPHVVFALAGLNPVQAGRIGILAGSDPELGVLGPVGTWIATTLGPSATFAYAALWPVLLGGIALLAARAVFLRRDVL